MYSLSAVKCHFTLHNEMFNIQSVKSKDCGTGRFPFMEAEQSTITLSQHAFNSLTCLWVRYKAGIAFMRIGRL